MAENETGAPAATANGADNAAQDGAVQVGILAQYTKDMSFENPNAPASLQQGGQPQIDVNVNVKSIIYLSGTSIR